MNEYVTNAILATVAGLIVFVAYCAKPAVRFLLYGMGLTRMVVYFVAVADACQQSASCETPDRGRLHDFLLAQLFASGFAQDLSIWFMYVRKPSDTNDGVFQPYVFPYLLFASLATITYFALAAWQRYQHGFLVAALIGTALNMCFFYYFVYRAVHREEEDPDIYWENLIKNKDVGNRRRVIVVAVMMAITVSNTLANWVMYGLSWIKDGPALFVYPVATMVIISLGSIACLHWAYTTPNRQQSALQLVIEEITSEAQHFHWNKAAVSFCITFAYVFGVGIALSQSTTVILSTTIAAIPYFSFIVVPLSSFIPDRQVQPQRLQINAKPATTLRL